MKFRKIRILRCLILAYTYLLLSNTSAAAKSFEWSKENLAKYPLTTIFGPDQQDSFAYVNGVEGKLKSDPNRKNFNFITLTPEWLGKRACSLPARHHGLIHTTSFQMPNGQEVRVAVPVSFRFSGDYSRKRMGELMISPILKVSLLEWAKGKKFTTLLSQKFLIQDFLMSKDIPNEQLKVNYSNILVSDPVEVSKGADVRIRIQWFANSICDESEFKLKIGDQIRLIKSK